MDGKVEHYVCTFCGDECHLITNEGQNKVESCPKGHPCHRYWEKVEY